MNSSTDNPPSLPTSNATTTIVHHHSSAAAATEVPPKRKWKCDICHTATFDEYEDALVHERSCCSTDDKHNSNKTKKKKEEVVKNEGSPPPSSSQLSSGAAASTGGGASSSTTKTTNGTTSTICRFLITDLNASRGYSKTNYRIDFIKDKHGLYDLVSVIFDILRKENLTHDSIYSHLWNLQLEDKVYMNGWRRQRFPGSDEFDRPSNDSDLDEGEPRLLNGLERPIEDGQKGSCSGESTTFEFVVENANLEVEFIDETKYPRVTAVPLQISTKVEDDWLTNTEKSRSIELVNAWDSYFRGENSWKRNRVTGDFIRCKPNHSSWGCEEFKVMGLLINAGAKFKKSWTNILQYAFVDRAETACSYQWYKLQKEAFRREGVGRRLTNPERIQLAKRKATAILRHHFQRGVPKKEPHPWKRVEKALRKRKKIDDTTSEEDKRHLCALYNCMVRDLEEEGSVSE